MTHLQPAPLRAWHDVVTTKDLEDSMERMAKLIAEQLRDSPGDGASARDPLGPQG